MIERTAHRWRQVNHQKLEEIKAQDGKTFVVMPLL